MKVTTTLLALMGAAAAAPFAEYKDDYVYPASTPVSTFRQWQTWILMSAGLHPLPYDSSKFVICRQTLHTVPFQVLFGRQELSCLHA